MVAWSPNATGLPKRTLQFHVFHNTLWTPLKEKLFLFERNGFVHIRGNVCVTCITLEQVRGHPPSLADKYGKCRATTLWLTEPSHPTGIDQVFCVAGRRVEPYQAGGREPHPLKPNKQSKDGPLSVVYVVIGHTFLLTIHNSLLRIPTGLTDGLSQYQYARERVPGETLGTSPSTSPAGL